MSDLLRVDIANIDLTHTLSRSNVGRILATGDKNAHRFGVRVYRNKETVDLGGYGVTGYFIRYDEETLLLTGESVGNVAYVELPQECYEIDGAFSLAIKISGNDITDTVRIVDGIVCRTQTDNLTAPGDPIPSLEDIFAQIAAMEKATDNAIDATRRFDDALENADLTTQSKGHFWRVTPDAEHEMPTYKAMDGGIVESGHVTGSDYVFCPNHLCIHFGDDTARCFLYFYDLIDGEYTPRWDILNTTTSSDVKNYLNQGHIKLRMLDIPDGVYMRFSLAVGEVDLYGWDGESFGMPLSADTSARLANGTEEALMINGSSGLTIPGDAKYVLCKNCQVYAIWGCRDGTYTALDVDDSRRFWVAPEGYDFFRARLYFGAQTPYENRTFTGDVSDLVSVVMDNAAEEAVARAKKVLEACKKVCGLKWTAMRNLAESSNASYTYKAGTEYNGIPYSSQWLQTHFLGWHVSPHTFVNAAGDPDSVLYKEVADNGSVTAPYYGLVCSSFATLCDGWPYPQTNAGFVYDPMVNLAWTAMPPLGAIYSDIESHCLIPDRIDRMRVAQAVSMYEGVRPVSSRTTRYSNINYTDDQSKFNSACLDEYMDNYGYVARHIVATSMADVPYADFDDVEIVNGSALPYHGDRCIHTSQDDAVLINIKDGAATLILTLPDGSTRSISIGGTAQVDVKPYLTQDGIYRIHTDADNVQASFEYRTVSPVACTVTDGKVSFDRNDWWYAFGLCSGSPFFEGAEGCSIPARADGDYSAWNQDGHKISKVYCVFYKGEYGAYPVQCV